MRVYKGKTKLRILIDCKCDLSGYASVTLTALKPNGTVVDFPAVVKDVEKGIVFYDVQSSEDLDMGGWWWFWPEVIFDDDRTARGLAEKVFVHER